MRYGRKGFDFGDFEITKREILASISIIAVMILIGILISGIKWIKMKFITKLLR